MLHLVVGATGPVGLGREICRRLAGRGQRVRALVRRTSSPAAVAELRALGVEVVAADLRDPRSLDVLCHGVTAILATATTTASRQPGDTIASVDIAGYHNLVDAARRAEVRRLVYTSYSRNTQWAGPCPLTYAKQAVERLIMSSGMAYTILRPSYFMEIWLGPLLGFDIAGARARIYGSGEQPISWIATADVAELAVRALTHSAADDAVLELGGPEALSPLAVIALCEELGGRRFEVERVPEHALEAQRRAAFQAGDALGESVAALELAYAAGDVIDMDELAARFGMSLCPVRRYAERVLARAR